jgi:hypothetical protein
MPAIIGQNQLVAMHSVAVVSNSNDNLPSTFVPVNFNSLISNHGVVQV